MRFLASLLVGKPFVIATIGVLFLVGFFAVRAQRPSRSPRPLLIAAIGWGLYAIWEWLVLVKTPEANIRVDLLVIWPVIALISGWALYRALR